MIDESIRHQSQMGYVKKSQLVKRSILIIRSESVLHTVRNYQQSPRFNKPPNITENHLFSHIWKARSNLESEVYTPQLFVPDPMGINPNSASNIRMVLEILKKYPALKTVDVNGLWLLVMGYRIIVH